VLRAFPREPTVDAGGRLVLHVATDSPHYTVRIERWSDGGEVVDEAGPFAGEDAPPGDPGVPWDWPSIEITLPAHLTPGAYIARFSTEGGAEGRGRPRERTPDARWGTALFVVRGISPARVLVNLPLFTYHAYNVAHTDVIETGDPGACLYTGHPVTLRRPGGGTGGHPWDQFNPDVYDRTSPRQAFAHWDLYALRWLARERIPVDLCTDLDLHRGDLDLDRYAMLCSFGHDEYWTREKRAHVETWLERGGNVAFFGGNTCWGRLRYDDATASLSRDGKWSDDHPEDSLTGLSWRAGGGKWAGARPPTGYRIERSDHELLRYTGLHDGDIVGAGAAVVGYEFDGVSSDAPAGLAVLGRAGPGAWDVADGSGRLWPGCNAAIVTFRRERGTVFNAGTTDWPRALAWGDAAVAAITRSVVRRFSERSGSA